MIAPHERPIPGRAADFAASLAAQMPVIETARLRLRTPHLADFAVWADILCGPAGPHLGGPFGRDDAFVEFAACCGMWLLRGFGVWTVETRDGSQVLGFVLIGFEPGDREPELGFLFTPSAEGKGFAHEAALAARGHAGSLGLPTLVSYIDPANTRSVGLARRLGARCDGAVDGSEVWRHFPEGMRS